MRVTIKCIYRIWSVSLMFKNRRAVWLGMRICMTYIFMRHHNRCPTQPHLKFWEIHTSDWMEGLSHYGHVTPGVNSRLLFSMVSRFFPSFLFFCFTSSICANKSSRVFISVVKTLILLISLSNGCIKNPAEDLISHPLLPFPTGLIDEASQQWGHTHLEADVPFLAAQTGQHEEDEREEARERDSHHSQRGWPWQLTQGGATYRTQAEVQPLWRRHNLASLLFMKET